MRLLVRHRYIFPNNFCKQHSLPHQIRAWVGLFANGNFVEHYTEVMLNTLLKMGYYNKHDNHQTNNCWIYLPPALDYKMSLFQSEPNSFVVFDRDMCLSFVKIRGKIETPRIMRQLTRSEKSMIWSQEVSREFHALRKRLDESGGVVWSKSEIKEFYSQLKERLRKFLHELLSS